MHVKNKFLIVLILLTIIKIVLCCFLPNFYIESYGYDDMLMMKLSDNISNGLWLGNYTDTTLVKGFFFPLFLSFLRLINISSELGISLLYIIASITFCYVTKDLFKNRKISYILYLILLFNPVTFSSETFQRLYRYVLGPAQILFLLSFLYGIYKNSEIKKIIPHLIGLSLTYLSVIYTREDYLFMNVLLLIMLILYIYKLKKKSLILIVFFIIVIPVNLLVTSLNQKYYGASTNNEIINSNFSKAYQNLMKIKPDKNIYRVSIPKSSLNKAMKVSPTLETLKELINQNYKESPDIKNGELVDGYMIWSLRRVAYYKGAYKSFKTSEEFWGKVNEELEKAFQENKLEKRFTIPSAYISPPSPYNLKSFIKTLPKTIKYVLTYEDFITYDYNTLKNSDKSYITKADESKVNYYPYYSLVIKTSNTNDLGTLTYKGVGGIFNIITFAYQKISLIINTLGVICFIILLFSKNKKILIPVLTLLTSVLLICGITYTDATSFEAIRYFYLAPVYITLIIFSMTSIFILWEDIQNGKIRTNYLVTMFKRRKKSSKLSSKST